MATASGLSAQIGFVLESTYGTAVTVTKFYEFENESINLGINRIEGTGLRAGRRVLANEKWVADKQGATGDVNFEVTNKDFGYFLKPMFGTVTTTQPNAGSNPTVYDHTGTVTDLQAVPSLTCQVGRPDITGTVQPFTYSGGVITGWEISNSPGGLLMLRLSFDFQDEATTSPALATASYTASATPFSYIGGTLTVGGSQVDVKNVSFTGANNMETSRKFLRGNALKKQPIENAFREYGGTMTADFNGLTDYARFTAGTTAALVTTWAGATISGSYTYTFQLTSTVRFDGGTPNVTGPDILDLELPFKVVDDGSTSPVTALYRTTQATP